MNVLHIGQDHIQRVLSNQLSQQACPCLIGRNLCSDVGHVVLDISRRIVTGQQQLAQCISSRLPFVHEVEVSNENTLFRKIFREGRHASGGDAADLSVMCPARRKKQQLSVRVVNGRDDCDIRQMRPAAVRIVCHEHVTGRNVRIVGNYVSDRRSHRPQMDRDMRSIHHQPASCVEHGTTEVEPLFHIGRNRGFLRYPWSRAGSEHPASRERPSRCRSGRC